MTDMKILLVHNFYGSAAPSGENTVYLAERELLRSRGHEVLEFTRNSDEIRARGALGIVQGALATPWNPFSAARLRRVLERERPDIMHVHNTFPLLSPAVFHATGGLPTAAVLTLHNYRTFCAAGIPERGGVPCTECLDLKSVMPAIRFGCYRNSRLATLPMAAMIALHRSLGTWTRQVDAFIALTGFQKDRLAAAGLPPERIHIKPHFYAEPPEPLPWLKREDRVVYIGRLGDYKGVHILLEAWRQWGEQAPALDIIGEGPERAKLQQMTRGVWPDERVTFHGQLPFPEVQDRLARSQLLVLPSLCFEGFPMVIREAFALGVPVAGSRLGSIPCIVEEGKTGVLFRPGDARDLLAAVMKIRDSPGTAEAMGRAARNEFEQQYTAEKNHGILMAIYRSAMSRKLGRAR